MTVELPDVARVTLEVPAREERSELLVGAGVRSAIPDLLREYAPAHRYAVISDDNVAPLHAEPLVSRLRQAGLAADPFTFPAGEASKNAGTWADLLESLVRAGVGRDGCVIAVGGGVTGDLAGFVASTFGRGVPLVQVPTSLLAMIDASIGGKTGIDLAAGKNLAGTFHQPRLVIADPEVLGTLPDAELRGGLAEAVKHGAIADGEYLEWMATGAPAILSREAESLRHLIEVSVRIKAGFVAEDARESGARAALNFGHTVAHGIEAVSGYAVPHGQAVAMGMVVEARLGEALGVTAEGTAARLAGVLRRLGLPTAVPPELDAGAVVATTATDKKARAGSVRYVLLESAGRVARTEAGEWTHRVEGGAVERALEEATSPWSRGSLEV